jgi:hypothetical protein
MKKLRISGLKKKKGELSHCPKISGRIIRLQANSLGQILKESKPSLKARIRGALSQTFFRCLQKPYYAPGTVLGTDDTKINKIQNLISSRSRKRISEWDGKLNWTNSMEQLNYKA